MIYGLKKSKKLVAKNHLTFWEKAKSFNKQIGNTK